MADTRSEMQSAADSNVELAGALPSPAVLHRLWVSSRSGPERNILTI